jgi:hypothetical protein
MNADIERVRRFFGARSIAGGLAGEAACSEGGFLRGLIKILGSFAAFAELLELDC